MIDERMALIDLVEKQADVDLVRAGLDMERLEREIEADAVERQITMSFLLADHVGLVDTPAFIAGDEGAFGGLSLDDLHDFMTRARQTLGVG